MSGLIGDGKGLSPILKMVAPMAKKYVTAENLDKVFEKLTEDMDLEEGERACLTITRKEGVVYGSVCSVNQQNTITGIYHQSPLHELLGRLIESN